MDIFFYRSSFAFFQLFFKNAISYKVSFIWVLVMPTLFMIFSNYNWFIHSPSLSNFVSTYSIYLGYMITITIANGLGVGLLMLRENGFLKMFKFISGNKYTVIFGFFLSQFFYLLLNIACFSLIAGLLFVPHYFLYVLILSIFIGIITILPIAFFFSWIPTLNIMVESVSPIMNLIPIILTFCATLNVDIHKQWITFLMLINPVEFISLLTRNFFNIITSYSYNLANPYDFIFIYLFFFSIGIFTLKKIGIVSKVIRN